MTNSNSLGWIIKNSKKQIPRIIILSMSNMILALVTTALALVSKYAIDAAQKAANATNDDDASSSSSNATNARSKSTDDVSKLDFR